MATLAELIERGGESIRQAGQSGAREILAGRERREQEKIRKETHEELMETSKQRREIAAKEEERNAEMAPIKKKTAESQLYGIDLSNMRSAQEMTATKFDPIVDQSVGFFDAYMESGNPQLLTKAKDVLGSLSKSELWKLSGASVPYNEFQGLTNDDIERSMATDEGTVALFQAIKEDRDMAQKLQRERNVRMIKMQSDMAKGEQKGKTAGEIEARMEAGLPATDGGGKTSGELKDARELTGQSWVNTLRDYGFDDEEMKEFGLSASMFGNMDQQAYEVEKGAFNGIVQAIAQGNATILGKDFNITDKDSALQAVGELEIALRGSEYLNSESPYTRMLDWVKGEINKGDYKKLKKRLATKTPAGHLGSKERARQTLSSIPGGE